MTNDQISWQSPQQFQDLDSQRVDVWRANLNLAPEAIAELASSLSQDELARANRFRFARDKNRYIAARGILRQILSKYLQISAQSIEFKYGDRGKPELVTNNDRSWQFNLSHSHEYALYGITQGRAIGIDLEYLREMEDATKIAQRFFSPQEYQLLASFAPAQQPVIFFTLWTAKEAYLKALGTGLAGALANFDIALNSKQQAYLQAIQGSRQTASKWSMYSCIPADNYIAAIAIDSPLAWDRVNYWSWHNDQNTAPS